MIKLKHRGGAEIEEIIDEPSKGTDKGSGEEIKVDVKQGEENTTPLKPIKLKIQPDPIAIKKPIISEPEKIDINYKKQIESLGQKLLNVNIIISSEFDKKGDQIYVLKYNNETLVSISYNDVKKLVDKFQKDIDKKIEKLIENNLDLQEKILDSQKLLNKEEKIALDNLYLELLRTEINIILRDLYNLYETLISDLDTKKDIEPVLTTLTDKFKTINNFLNEQKTQGIDSTKQLEGLEQKQIEAPKQTETQKQTGGAKSYCSKTLNYCKYIKYKLKYINLKKSLN